MNTVIVTGSSGFVGSNLCHRLCREGYTVVGVDIDSPTFELPDAAETRTLDLTAPPTLPDADAIVHLAAHSQVQPVVENPTYALENVEMTRHVLTEADRMDACVINASSRDVYGSAITPAEDDVTTDSPNGYAASKVASEALANAYRNTRDVSVTSLRLANVYGPRDTNHRVIPIFIALADAGETLTVYGEGKLLDFVHVDDVCDAIVTALDRIDVVAGEAINLGSAVGTVLSDVADLVATSVEPCPGWELSTDRTGDVGRYVADISKAKSLLDFQPTRRLDDGLSETLQWYREHPDVLASLRAEL